jgi:hypothetical protein
MALENIMRKILIDPQLEIGDYINEQGFFFHTTGGGIIKYVPIGNADDEIITITFEASDHHNVPDLTKRIIADGTTATGIYVGWGM